MRIAVFGGSFNPPHKGHIRAAMEAKAQLAACRLLVIPAAAAPHKPEVTDSPAPEDRLRLAQLAFSGIEGAFVSDMEIIRGGRSYTVDTLETLHKDYPKDELVFLMGADMLLCFDTMWKSFERIMELAALGVFERENSAGSGLHEKCAELRNRYGAKIEMVNLSPVEISSTQLRELLPKRLGREYLTDEVYSEIIRKRLYGAQPELKWLREKVRPFMEEKRMAHILGCESEAKALAARWGEDELLASEAGILHDITKKQKALEQLNLCEKYGIITDNDEKASYKLLHSKTGAARSRELFGINDAVYGAIAWHTTGRADMTLLEKIIYIADYIEPNRDFDGVDKLRKIAYEDIDRAVEFGLEMSMEDLERHGKKPHANSVAALKSIRERLN